MPSRKSFSYIWSRAAGGTWAKVTRLRGMGDQIAREARASSGASVGTQGERVRDIVGGGEEGDVMCRDKRCGWFS